MAPRGERLRRLLLTAALHMTSTVPVYASNVWEAVSPFILDPALLSVSLLVAAFWMLWLLAAISLISD